MERHSSSTLSSRGSRILLEQSETQLQRHTDGAESQLRRQKPSVLATTYVTLRSELM
jgi:hypothetical protein